ncbi:hypothetical protein HPP92_009618 [Vanilla planifolia]|uniref:AP complex mu/sigma subunit domain-containing protein n=1 Tax=Vanilla planifolia TaxID=51239 RepID=A0A835V7L1_VANPL|nr:hypothetical protein HPP92_009618 [Vanilla planifolia]
MGIRFVLLVNKQGQTRLAQYYEYLTLEERRALEGEIVRKCLARTEQQCSFVEHRNYKIVYRRYASLFFLVGVDNDELDTCRVRYTGCSATGSNKNMPVLSNSPRIPDKGTIANTSTV